MLSVNRSATGPLRRLLPAVALALFLALALRPGPAAALGGAPPVPPQVIDAGISHNCALAASGGADCWGTGDIDNSGPYIQVTVGELHTCALTPSGAADCWGGNNDGQATDQSGPYTQVSAGSAHTCALTPAGAVDCWGFDDDGQATDQAGPYRPYEPNEPNDTYETAIVLNDEETVRNNYIGVAGDVDRYYFEAVAGQMFIVEIDAMSIDSDLDSLLTLYDTDGTTVLDENDNYNNLDSRLVITIPADGYYDLTVRDVNHPNEGGPRHFYTLRIAPFSLYVSPTGNGTVAGIATTAQDLLRYDFYAGEWSMWFDGSDVGITKALSAFARLPGGDWLLVFKANQTTPAGTFTPWDIARFTPSSMGATTAGTFSWYFDGSDVGLTTAAEKIDALDWSSAVLLISTGGALAVPLPGSTLKAQDEDLIVFYPATTGPNTTGDWYGFFDGTAVPGMKGEDLSAVEWDHTTGVITGGITGSFKIGGVSGTGKDILGLTPAPVPGGYSAAKQSLSAIGFNLLIGGYDMD